MIDELLNLFGGSARPLIAHLAEVGKLTLEDVVDVRGNIEFSFRLQESGN